MVSALTLLALASLYGDVYALDVALADERPVAASLASDGIVRIHDVETWKVLRRSKDAPAESWDLDISPDGSSIALVDRGQMVRVWKWEVDGDEAWSDPVDLAGSDSEWEGWRFGATVLFSPTGDRLFAAHYQSDRLLLDADGGLVARLQRRELTGRPGDEIGPEESSASIYHEPMSWSGDGKWLAVITEDRVHIHDSKTGELRPLDFDRGRRPAESVAVDSTGSRIVIGHIGGVVDCWNVTTGTRTWSHTYADPVFGRPKGNGGSLGIGDLAFSPDGRQVAFTSLKAIHAAVLWAEDGKLRAIGPFCGGRMREPALIAWAPDSESLFYAYVSGVMPIRCAVFDDSDEAPTPMVSIDLARANPVDVGWGGMALTVRGASLIAYDSKGGSQTWRPIEPR